MYWMQLAIAGVVAVAGGAGIAAASGTKPERADRFFEMRTYITHPGRMPNLHARFRDHTNKLFVKHGMELVGYWSPVSGENAENTLVYVLAYPSKDAREKAWKDFLADPDWIKAKAESEKDGPIVSKVNMVYMNPTDYSPIK